ncbi:MAG: CBS domain-containing protein [Eubacteriales bacterium]
MNVLMLLKPKSEVEYLTDACTLRQGLEKMRIHGYTAIPVLTKEGMYAGSVSEGDFLWHIVHHAEQIDCIQKCENYRIREIMKPDRNPAVTVDVDMDTVIERATQQNFIPVTDDRGYFIGIVTRQDLIRRLCGMDADCPSVSSTYRIYSS